MKKKSTGNKITKTNVSVLVSHLSWLLPPTSDRWNCSCTLHFAIWMSLTIHLYLEVDLQRRRRYNRIETFFHHLLSRLLNSPQKASHLPLLLSQTVHVSMCYNHAGKQKKNWLMRGAVAILTHKARPQNIPWLWRGKVQTCFSWRWGVYSLSWSPFTTQTSGLVTHWGLTFENMVHHALGDVLTSHYQAINATTVPFIVHWAGRSHGKMWL